MAQYIEYVSDRLLVTLGLKKNIMFLIHLIGWKQYLFKVKRIFLKKRVGEYSNAANPNADADANDFELDEDF